MGSKAVTVDDSLRVRTDEIPGVREAHEKIKELENTVDDIIEYCRVTDKISRRRAWMNGSRRRYGRT